MDDKRRATWLLKTKEAEILSSGKREEGEVNKLASENQSQVEKNVAVLGLANDIWGIFFGVWWAFFFEKVLSTEGVSPLFPSVPLIRLKVIFILVSLEYTGIVVYFLVRWVWYVAAINAGLAFRDYLKHLARISSSAFPLTSGIIVLSLIAAKTFGIDTLVAVYGGLSLLIWMVTSVVLIHWRALYNERQKLEEWK